MRYTIELNNKTPSVFARVWPQRFVSTLESADLWTELRGFYLVGLSSDDSKRSRDEKREIENKFIEVLRSFEQQLRADPLKYDQNISWVQVQHVGKSALGEVKLDDRDWGEDDGDGEVDSDSDEDEDDDQDLLQLGDLGDADSSAKRPKQSKKKLPPPPKKKSIPGKKLRPALDVLNRIRWDASLEAGEFVVGYEDRFLGVKEMEVKKWKMEQTDLEFIPLHRVVYFKRVSDGVLVWDRETKTDLVFGGGAGAGAGGGQE